VGLAAPVALPGRAAAAEAVPLARYIAKENLLVYFEFSGLDAHAATWKKTAAYRMLTETPLGALLDEVAGQLLDRGLNLLPNRRLSGPEVVTVVKHVAQHGCAWALHAKPTADSFSLAVVFRGASGKEIRPLSSRLLGSMMGSGEQPRIERKEGRPIVVVPHSYPGAPKDSAWAWWPEKDDLVLTVPFPSAPEAVLAALDGKAPSAADHPIVRELAKPEGSFDPVCIAFWDVAGASKAPATKLAAFLDQMTRAGIQRLDYRWGFDGDGLMDVTRVVAPRPRKPALALFDQPGFDKTALLPMPDGVESFVELSLSPSQLLDSIAELGPPGAVKARVEEFAETIQSAGKIDFQKDFLAQLGPRTVLYVAPGRSAAAGDESFETSWLQGFRPEMALAALSKLPKVTLVAEIHDADKFGKALDGVIIALNNELRAQAMEKSNQEAAAQPDQGGAAGANAGRGAGARTGAGGQRTPRRRSMDRTAAPQFEPVPGQVKAYLLRTPSDSALRFGPSSFRPVIRVEGNYVALSVAADAAESALKAVRRKDWKPSEDLQRACEHVPAKLVMLGIADPRDVLAPFLASLPGTLQTMINSVITLARTQAGAPGGGMNQPGGPPPGYGGASGGRFGAGGPRGPMMGGSGARGREGGPPPGVSGGSGGPPPGIARNFGGPGAPAPGGSTNAGSAADAMVELKVDPEKLPKADDIRSRLFLTSVAMTVSDQDIRLITRKAFPNLFNWSLSGLSGFLGAQAARSQMEQQAQGGAAGPNATPAGPQAAPGQPGASGPPGGRPQGSGGGPAGRRGGRGRGDG
jgi:hypothetical protein